MIHIIHYHIHILQVNVQYHMHYFQVKSYSY